MKALISTVSTATAAAILAAPAAAVKPKLYGTIARANKAAAAEVYQTFFNLDPKLRQPGDAPVTFRAGCRRLTARTFRCDWSGEAPDYYTAAGTVRVAFRPYGVDATLTPGATCAPEGNLYAQTDLSECP